jgi:hypothetical protein
LQLQSKAAFGAEAKGQARIALSPSKAGGRRFLVRVRARVWVAWATLAVYWGCVIAAAVLRARSDPTHSLWDDVSTGVVWGAYPTVGAVILARQPRNRIGWLCCAVGLLVGPAFLAQAYAWYALVYRPGSLPGGLAMAWLGEWPWFMALGLVLTFLLLLFPTGQLVSRRWRVVAWAAATNLGLGSIWGMFKPTLVAIEPQIVPNPLGLQQSEALFELLESVVIMVQGLLTILSAASIVVRFRRARGVERQQLKWFTYATVVSVLFWVVFAATGLQQRLPEALTYVIGAVFLGAVPVAIGIALLRYRLYDIDRLINRTLVYGLLTALLAGVYGSSVLIFGQVFGGVGRDPPSWVVAGATLAVAALFQPTRRRIQAVVDRHFNRRKYDAAKTVEAFSVRLQDELDLDALTAELLVVVDKTIQPTRVSCGFGHRPRIHATELPEGVSLASAV